MTFTSMFYSAKVMIKVSKLVKFNPENPGFKLRKPRVSGGKYWRVPRIFGAPGPRVCIP